MQRAYQAYSPREPQPSLPSQQNKVILQREYREKEGECFSTLRDVIKDLTGEELRTRQEILRKVIDILSTASEARKQSGAQAEYGTHSPTQPEDTAVGYFTQSSPWTQSWQSGPEFDAVFPQHYGAPFHDQQHHFMSSLDPAFDHASSSGYANPLQKF